MAEILTPGQKWIIEGVANVTFEDSGQACIAEIADDDSEDGPFVNFQSWIEGAMAADHPISGLGGWRVRVEITVLSET